GLSQYYGREVLPEELQQVLLQSQQQLTQERYQASIVRARERRERQREAMAENEMDMEAADARSISSNDMQEDRNAERFREGHDDDDDDDDEEDDDDDDENDHDHEHKREHEHEHENDEEQGQEEEVEEQQQQQDDEKKTGNEYISRQRQQSNKQKQVSEGEEPFQAHKLLFFLLQSCIDEVSDGCKRVKEISESNKDVLKKKKHGKRPNARHCHPHNKQRQILRNSKKKKLGRKKKKNEKPTSTDSSNTSQHAVDSANKNNLSPHKQKDDDKPDFSLKQVFPTSSPLTRLLIIVQRELFIKANSHRQSSHADVNLLQEYILKAIHASIFILTQYLYTLFAEYRSECLNIISNSFIGKALLPLLTKYFEMLPKVYFYFLKKIINNDKYTYYVFFLKIFLQTETWQDLTEFLLVLDELCNMDEEISNELAQLQSVQPLTGDNSVLVESAHSYLPNTLDEKHVSIPGANFLILQFDERCNTERGQDYLQLCLADGTPICSDLHGPPHEWNTSPLIVPHNEILFRFQSRLSGSQSQHHWGYACLVTGIRLGHHPKHSIMLDLLHTAANVVGKFILSQKKKNQSLRTLMVGREPDETEKAHLKWLTSPLFSRGREKYFVEEKSEKDKDDSKEKELKKKERSLVGCSDNQLESPKPKQFNLSINMGSPSWSPVVSHQSFLEDLAVMKVDSKAAEFVRKMFGQLKKEATDRIGGKIVDQTIHYAIAAILKHLGLVEIARKFASGSESTPGHMQSQWNQKLLFVFKLAKRLRQWIINEKQSLQQDYERTITEASERGEQLDAQQIKV
ncbi:hypothetical protein RFI_23475, partial [Reticulomyxa filosa]